MKCEQCNHKTDNVTEYGGLYLCSYCYEVHNPKSWEVERLTKEEREHVEDEIKKLEWKIADLKHRLVIDDKIIFAKTDKLTFTSSYTKFKYPTFK